jgi:hypothetical protein
MTNQEWLKSTDLQAMLEHALHIASLIQHQKENRARLRKFMIATCYHHGHINPLMQTALHIAEQYLDGKATAVQMDKACMDIDNTITHYTTYEDLVVFATGQEDRLGEHIQHTYRMIAQITSDHTPYINLLREIIDDPYHPPKLQPITSCKTCKGKGGWATTAGPKGGPGAQTVTTCKKCNGTGQTCPWIDKNIKTLTQAAHDHRDKARQYDQTRLSILADALEEAGCPTTRTEWLCESLGTHHHDGQPDTIIHGLYHAGDPRKNHHHHDDKCNRKTHTYPLISHLRSPGPHPTGCHVMDLLLTLLED